MSGTAEWPDKAGMRRRWLGFTAMAMGNFMAILDIQIVAASLPQIQLGVSASADQVSWIQTAYLIPEVVMIPLSAYFARIWGAQRVFLLSCTAFIVMSVIAGLSTSFEMLVLTRALQGFSGGAMIPMVAATAFTAFPPEKRAVTSAIVASVASFGPMLGPVLGGHLTEWLSWRWVFFVNLPPGLLILFMVGRYGDFGPGDRGDRSLGGGFDWFGLVAMALFLMSLQYVLEEGARDGWWSDDHILWLSVLSAVSCAMFVWRQLTVAKPIVELRAFRDTNFALGTVISFVAGMGLFGLTFLIPLYLGHIRNFSPADIGATMAVTGIVGLLGAPLMPRIIGLLGPRPTLVLGFVLCTWGMVEGLAMTKEWGFEQFAWLQVVRTMGSLFVMSASQMITMATLPVELIKGGAGVMNLSRTVGGAVCLALMSTTLTQSTARHFSEMTARIGHASFQAQVTMLELTERMRQLGLDEPAAAARKALHRLIQQEAQVLAFSDAFYVLAMVTAGATLISLFTGALPGARRGFGNPGGTEREDP